MGLDGLFRTLLLLKKKKYAALKITNLDELISNKRDRRIEPKLKRETKGIDVVRREFCDFAKEVLTKVLDTLLSVNDRDNIL